MKILYNGAEKLGLNLTPEQLQQFEVYYHELVEWNKRVNLTSVTGYEEAQITHFLDSLTVMSGFPPPQSDRQLSIIDVGSGAGFPGIPLHIVLPGLRLVLIEATAKKAEFLRHITDKLELDNMEIVRGRAEEVSHDESYRESFDIVVSRALAPLNVLVELTLPFCAVGGRLIAQKKGDISQEVYQASRAVSTLGGELSEVLDITMDEFDDDRCLVIIDKVKDTPKKYPRRPGIPAKKPI
jgi:16S rRNA (guanine527-N7)-methyltransferase